MEWRPLTLDEPLEVILPRLELPGLAVFPLAAQEPGGGGGRVAMGRRYQETEGQTVRAD